MMKLRRATLALVAVAVVAVAVVGGGSASSEQAKTLTIGWAYDGVGNMAPFDGPALATAKSHIATINKAGWYEGQAPHVQHAGQQARDREGMCAEAALAGLRRDHDHLRRRLRRAGRPGGDQRRQAHRRGLHRNRSDGPEALRAEGKLAFSYGNVAQDEGSAMAEFAWKRGWRTASLATDTVIVYFRNVVQAFKARWTQLGGKIVTEETYQSAGGSPASWQSTVTRLNAKPADVIVTATAAAFGAQVPILNGLRTLGNNTPFLNSWAGDGNYWYTPDPKITNYYYVTFASAFGNDPIKAVNALAKKNAAAIAKAGSTGAFVTGPAAIDGILVALKRTGGNTNGAALAAQMQKFKNVPTLSGLVSFSTTLHTVYGRAYRVIRVQNNTPVVIGVIKAKVVPKI